MSEQKWAVMCSMTGGWGVARPEHVYREDDGLLACTEWESLYDTWAEAMQEAGRQARTVTVTLPADPNRHAPLLGIEIYSDEPDRIKFAGPDGYWSNAIYLEADHIKPFALALLAHARKYRN